MLLVSFLLFMVFTAALALYSIVQAHDHGTQTNMIESNRYPPVSLTTADVLLLLHHAASWVSQVGPCITA